MFLYLLIPVDVIEQATITRGSLIYSSWIHLNFPNLLTVLRLKISYTKVDRSDCLEIQYFI